MEKRKGMTKRLLFVITFAVTLFVALLHIKDILALIGKVGQILKPIIVAFIIAFVLNIFMKLFEKIIYKIFPNKKVKNSKTKEVKEICSKGKRKTIRILAIALTVITVVLVFRGLIGFIIPQIYESVESIVKGVPGYLRQIKDLALQLKSKDPAFEQAINEAYIVAQEQVNKIFKNITNYIPEVINITKNVTGFIFDLVLSFILAIYFLASKENLRKNAVKITYALYKQKTANYMCKIAKIANSRFQAFIRGQLMEMFVIGFLCYFGMLIFKMPYAVLISVIVAVTALIPIFGAWGGGALGALLILTVSPLQAVFFVIFIIVLQQIEGNLIYPKVVGDQVGISGLWVLIALVIGNAIAGVPGILIGIPLFATVYTLFGEYVEHRLEEKEIKLD